MGKTKPAELVKQNVTPSPAWVQPCDPANIAEGQALSLTPEMRAFLLHGPRTKLDRDIVRHGGAATVLVTWRRHREELLEACPPGRRPWAEWILQRRFKQRPPGELGELRAIAQLNLYRDAAEVAFVERRLEELSADRNFVPCRKKKGRRDLDPDAP